MNQGNTQMIKKLSLCALAVCSAFSGGFVWAAESDYQLEQVLMLSRHNLRAPLADNGSVLAQATKKNWPKWDVPGGQLTTKGGVLEVYMGRYTREWLAQQGLVKGGECPSSDDIYAYANSLQRTVATAQFFIAGAFPGCDVAVSHQDEMGAMDPIFNPVITNDSEDFKKQALSAMSAADEKLALKPAFQRLEKIIDYKNSAACNGKKQCDLSGTNTFHADNGKEPGVSGPLQVGNSLVDAFTLQYYEGMPLEQVAWGQIKTPEQWKALSAIKNAYQDTLFTSPQVARAIAAPLVDYIRSMLVAQDQENAPKVTLMVGHDSNIASLLTALDFKPYDLADQNERTPIGGMVQFQRWLDKKNNRELVKVEYVYQSTEQLRNADALSLDNPPKRVTLQMAGCQTDANGFCPWDQFVAVLNTALQGTSLQVAEPATTDTAAQEQTDDVGAVAAQSDAGKTTEAAKSTEKPEQDKTVAAKAAAEKAEQEKAAAAKAATEKAEQEKAAAAKAAAEKVEQEKAAATKAAAEKAEQEKAAAAKAAAEKAEQEKAAATKAATEKAEQEKSQKDVTVKDTATNEKATTEKEQVSSSQSTAAQ